jgi:hypothetical protein
MFVIAVILPASASATVPRTYVAESTGTDSNDCTHPSPCLTFQHAHDQTSPGGEINVLESGNYSSLTITKPITVDGNGYNATMTPFDAGVRVDLSGGSGRVVLRDLRINAEANAGVSGIDMVRGGTLVVDNLRIWGGTQAGIHVSNSVDPGVRLLVDDSRVQGSQGRGMTLEPSKGWVRATVRDTGIDNSAGAAILLKPTSGATARATVRRSSIDANGNGLAADATGGTAVFSVFSSAITDSGADAGGLGVAIYVNGANATARIARNEIQANVRGLQALNSGKILSSGDNDIVANTVNGAPTGTWPRG